MIQLTEKKITKFHQKILSWYAENKRDLPWRKTRDPYNILVSEVMSQQTQISRVIPKYEAWISAFPDVQSLAQASTADVLRLWSGLGYNRRALYLKKTAEVVTQNYEGKFPQTVEELKKFSGIGEYTARAIACFAFNEQIAVLDTNVRKVLLTQFSIAKDQSLVSEKSLQQLADQLLPKGNVLRLRKGRLLKANAYEWNQALMDYASATLKEHKIPIPKQSKFVGSNRYYRGQIIKYLLKHQRVSRKNLSKAIDYHKQNAKASLSAIVNSMVKDGLVEQQADQLLLKE